MTGLSATDVRIRYEESEHAAPDGVSFDVAPGEVVLLLGPSGSGKSTLALALNGLIPHDVEAELSGSVTVDGLDTAIASVARLSEHVSMVFQDPDAQIVTASVFDEVCFGPENLLVPRDEVLRRAEDALRRVGLWERRADDPDRLSGGGKQRLAIACALAMRTRLLVFDEPTANLDPAGIEEVYAALAQLAASREHGIVLIEHNLDAAMPIVDRVVVIDAWGRPVVAGPAREVMTTRAAELIALGVWLPSATLAALALRAAGAEIAELPLTPSELAVLLAEIEPPTATPPLAPSTAEPVVQVTGLSVARRGTRILNDVSLRIDAGSFTAIVGVNGAGKTTLLQAIAGVSPAPKGRIRVDGLDPATAAARESSRRVGFVFQNPEHQFIRSTVTEELRHGLELQRADNIDETVERMLARLGLAGLGERHPFLLSGGQKRRLSVATALIGGARVLALDEPTFGQDRERAAELIALLTELRSEGTTVIAVTHDLQLVAEVATHVVVMRDGRVVRHAPTAEILADDTLVEAGLRLPPLAQATRGLPGWRGVTRLTQLQAMVRT
ncbi:ABC transporter ATP-binding protein [Microbacteriaceae bacterium VKM Ac-2855]|nr:ABC transporter ATP-binding protein [Microbacteriaceae bacterium VKM Ac-2855]